MPGSGLCIGNGLEKLRALPLYLGSETWKSFGLWHIYGLRGLGKFWTLAYISALRFIKFQAPLSVEKF